MHTVHVNVLGFFSSFKTLYCELFSRFTVFSSVIIITIIRRNRITIMVIITIIIIIIIIILIIFMQDNSISVINTIVNFSADHSQKKLILLLIKPMSIT